MRLLIHAMTACALLATTPAFGASRQDWRDCVQERDRDLGLAACTRILDDRKTSMRDRVVAHINRAIAWTEKGLFDRAIEDTNDALKINPRHPEAFINRAIAWRYKDDLDRSIADYDEAIRLDSRNARAFNNRGIVYRLKKDYARAN